MSGTGSISAARKPPCVRSLLVVAGIGLLAGGCSSGSPKTLLEAVQAPNLAEATSPAPAQDGRTELQKATEHWGKAYSKNPRDAQTAINYAKNLKALGEKQQALAVLQQVSTYHGNNRSLNAEYGRLALEFDQVSLAQKLLEQADDPANPDWRVISARGTVLAKQGVYRDAIPLYQRALTLAPTEASILNNLAMAHLALGEADKAEPLLKRAAATGGSNGARVSQNLALVQQLQGREHEAKMATAPEPLTTGTVDKPQRAASSDDGISGWTTKVAAAKPAR